MYYFPKFKLTTRPIDDDYMTYDSEEHRYILTVKAVKTKLNIDMIAVLGSIEEAKYRLDDISEKFYDIVYENANQDRLENNIKIKEYLMANDNTMRNEIQRCMLAYIRASLSSDIDAIGDEHGINYETGAKVQLNEYDDLPMQLKRKLKRAKFFFGGVYCYQLEEGEYHNGY